MGSSITKPNRLLVLGYYNRSNFGDDAFVTVLAREWADVAPQFRNVEQVTQEEVAEADLIVMGGGEIMSEYFTRFIWKRVLPYSHCPIYAVGVGVPYSSAIAEGHLDYVDRFWCRFEADVAPLSARFGAENVTKIPDLAVLHPVPKKRSVFRRPRVALCLSHSLVSGPQSDELLTQLGQLVTRMQKTHDLTWLAFNTDEAAHESDIELHRRLTEHNRIKIPVYSGTELLPQMAEQDIIIASRFHAHVFAALIGIPTVSLELTRKIQQWNIETVGEPKDRSAHVRGAIVQLERTCEFCAVGRECDGCLAFMGHVTSIPVGAIIAATKLAHPPTNNYQAERAALRDALKGIITEPPRSRASPPYFRAPPAIQAIQNRLVTPWREFCSSDGSVDQADFVAKTTMLAVTGNPDHSSVWGLFEQIVAQGASFDYPAAVEYIMRLYYSTEMQWERRLRNQPAGLFSLSRTHQARLEGAHRWGWSHCVNAMTALHSDQAPIMDTFIDSTFGWHASMLESLGVIPYLEPWMGFVHHPAEAVGSVNDCRHMLSRPSFQQSLASCRALFVMSSDLRDWLLANGIRVPIHVVRHPTGTRVPLFEWKDFAANAHRRIVQIGAWQRDAQAIFRIPAAKGIAKAVLKTYDASTAKEDCCRTPEPCRSDDAKSDICPAIDKLCIDVEVIEHVPDREYDILLTKNIVLLPLQRVVACNTLIECIARNTPVLVPRLPAVVEYLGEGYPLYYASDADATRLMGDMSALRAGYKWLKHIDKRWLEPEAFIKSIQEALK